MYTLFDFITHVKGVEYLLALTFIAGYMIYWEALKPKPFKAVVNTGRDDLTHIRERGRGYTRQTIGRIVSAPFIGLAYIVALPVGFFVALSAAVVNLTVRGASAIMGKSVSFEWRPMEAYFEGRKKKAKKSEGKKAEGK